MERREIPHHPLVEIELVRVDGLGMLERDENLGTELRIRHTWRRLSRRENCLPQWQANGRSPVCFLGGWEVARRRKNDKWENADYRNEPR
jgi:hypothetical protein